MDELPQAAAGKTIMTTEPKFVPATAAKIKVEDFSANIRMIDCVGYVVKAAKGYEDENGPRLVMTPWYSELIPFTEAAEIGTEKVIKEHSTIGIVVTTDGSIGDIPRSEYVEAEKTVIEELNTVGKPYIVLLNSVHPMLPDTEALADKLKEEFDFILIDCPPSLGLLTINAFTACDSILIPVQSEYYALEGLSQLLNTIKLVRKHFNPQLKIEGVLLTMFDRRTNLGQQVNSEVKKFFGDQVYDTIIPRNVRLSEAPSHGLAIIDYDKNSTGAHVYQQLAKEVLANHGKE